jgi:hypothetical protein
MLLITDCLRRGLSAGLYPAAADEYEGLAAAIERLNLNDASVKVKKETSDALGAGFRYNNGLSLQQQRQLLMAAAKPSLASAAVPAFHGSSSSSRRLHQQVYNSICLKIIECVTALVVLLWCSANSCCCCLMEILLVLLLVCMHLLDMQPHLYMESV